MANVNVTLRMDENLKKQADELFSDFGLSFNAAMIMFAKQSVREQRIPFEITRNTITMANPEALASVSESIIKENSEAYKELAK